MAKAPVWSKVWPVITAIIIGVVIFVAKQKLLQETAGENITFVKASEFLLETIIGYLLTTSLQAHSVSMKTLVLLQRRDIDADSKAIFEFLEEIAKNSKRRLAPHLLAKMSTFVWMISEVPIETAYYYLGEFLQYASEWDGIHYNDLDALTPPPSNKAATRYFTTLKTHGKKQKTFRRILIVEDSFWRKLNKKELTGDDCEKLKAAWDASCCEVTTYFVSESTVAGYLENIRPTLSSPDEQDEQVAITYFLDKYLPNFGWSDCALYDGGVLIAYRKPGEDERGGGRGGWLGIWPISRLPGLDQHNQVPEQEASALAIAAKHLFLGLPRNASGGSFDYVKFTDAYHKILVKKIKAAASSGRTKSSAS